MKAVSAAGISAAIIFLLAHFWSPVFHFARAEDFLFSEGFESNNFDNWDEVSGKWDTVKNEANAHSGKVRAEIKGATKDGGDILLKEIEANDFDNISTVSLSYWYKISKQLEDGDHVVVEWSSDGESWNQIADYNDLEEGEWASVSYDLPFGGDDEEEFKFRFVADLNGGSDVFWLDDVILSGEPVSEETPSPQGSISGFKFKDSDADGVFENEEGLEGWVIVLYDSSGQTFLASQSTDGFGNFKFSNLASGSFVLKETLKDGWLQTYPTSLSHWTISLSEGEEAASKSFGNAPYKEILGMKVVALSSDIASSSEFLVFDETMIQTGSESHRVIIPEGTKITGSGSSSFDFTKFGIEDVLPGALAGFGSGTVADGVLQLGIPNLGLEFSAPITVKIFVGLAFNGQTLDVVRSSNPDGGWTIDGIVEPAKCLAAEGFCVFQATKASYFAATHNVSSSNSSSSSGSGESSGVFAIGGSSLFSSPAPAPTPVFIPSPTPSPAPAILNQPINPEIPGIALSQLPAKSREMIISKSQVSRGILPTPLQTDELFQGEPSQKEVQEAGGNLLSSGTASQPAFILAMAGLIGAVFFFSRRFRRKI